MTALRGAENAAGATNFEIAHGDAKTGAERAVLFDRVDAFARGANRHHLARQKEISVSFVFGPTDTSAQLIKIGQAEAIGAVDNDRVRVGNVETASDNGGANQ